MSGPIGRKRMRRARASENLAGFADAIPELHIGMERRAPNPG
jgi:hypothetical protein